MKWAIIQQQITIIQPKSMTFNLWNKFAANNLFVFFFFWFFLNEIEATSNNFLIFQILKENSFWFFNRYDWGRRRKRERQREKVYCKADIWIKKKTQKLSFAHTVRAYSDDDFNATTCSTVYDGHKQLAKHFQHYFNGCSFYQCVSGNNGGIISG